MTDEQINRQVAEKICGWSIAQMGGVFVLLNPSGNMYSGFSSVIRDDALSQLGKGSIAGDYTTDRNAIAEMEEAIERAGKSYAYTSRLMQMLDFRSDDYGYYPIRDEAILELRRASPRQCAEAALRAFGLWEE